jgi:hypothetical protein
MMIDYFSKMTSFSRFFKIFPLLFFLIGTSSEVSSRPNFEIILKGGWGYSPIESYYTFPSNSFVLGGEAGVQLSRTTWITLGFNHSNKSIIVNDDVLGKPLFYNTVEFLSINSQIKFVFNERFWTTHPYFGGGIGIHKTKGNNLGLTKGNNLGLVSGILIEDSTLFPSFLIRSGLELPTGIPRLFAVMEGEVEYAPGKRYAVDGFNIPQSEGAKLALSFGLGLQI